MLDLDLSIKFEELDFSWITLIFGLYLVAIGVVYYFIFHKHHKRNKVELDELLGLVTKFYTLTMLSTFLIFVGIFCIINANSYKEDRNQVITWVLTGIIIITATITNFVFYIKRNLKDLVQEEREQTRKNTMKIGEILELIFFIIFILMPIWRIPEFIEIYDNKEKLATELFRTFGLAIASLVLLIHLNPLDIKGRLKKIFTNKNKKLK